MQRMSLPRASLTARKTFVTLLLESFAPRARVGGQISGHSSFIAPSIGSYWNIDVIKIVMQRTLHIKDVVVVTMLKLVG